MSPERPVSTEAPAPKQSSGVFVAVVGPSGAGKDTLMSRAARHVALDPRVRFVRRVVTRKALAASEDHDTLDEAGFAQAQAQGAFCLAWEAHGLRYGLRRSVVDELNRGRTLVANLSRRSLADAACIFGILAVVEITASPEILLKRLVLRGRESEAAVRQRLERQVPLILPGGCVDHVRIDNSVEVSVGTDLFVTHLNDICRRG